MSKKLFLLSIAAAGVLVAAVYGFSNGRDCQNFNQAYLKTPNQKIRLALAQTAMEQERGLGGCRAVPPNAGMYFPFPARSTPVFWMKDMLIPIDIVWLSQNKVVAVYASLPPPADPTSTDLKRYQAPQPIDAVLEVGAGQAKAYGLVPQGSVMLLDK